MEEGHIFSNQDLKKLLIPLIVEQLLSCLMGTIDTMMVSNVGSEAISAVSLVDSINILVIQGMAALAAGGTILCSQYIGNKNEKDANQAARQVMFVVAAISVIMTVFCLAARTPLLKLIFGKVDEGVMSSSQVYFFFTAMSFPFLALYGAGASIFRAQGNTRCPMVISVISNFLNIIGNAVLIWVFHLGVAGAAIATLGSRIFCAVVVTAFLRRPNQVIVVRNYLKIRPNWRMIKKILSIGIPSGVENSMFQFGKLAIQSTVSTLGTAAIAAQAMANILESLNGIAGVGIGIGLMTVVGQCMGAGREDEAVYYIKKLSVVAEVALTFCCILVLALTKPILMLGGMEPESARICFRMVVALSIVKPLVWIFSFLPAYGMRAAGDVKFSMLVSCVSMWLFRVSLCIFLCRKVGMGPMGVWIGMFADWTVRGIAFTWRFHSRRWLRHRVI